jgi:hypothetical protein
MRYPIFYALLTGFSIANTMEDPSSFKSLNYENLSDKTLLNHLSELVYFKQIYTLAKQEYEAHVPMLERVTNIMPAIFNRVAEISGACSRAG